MKRALLFAIGLYFGFTSVSAQLSLTKLWDKTYGGNQNEEARTMLPTDDGGWLLAGFSNSGISSEKSQSGRGDLDYWVVKVDSIGNKVWDKTFGGSGEDLLRAAVATNDGGFILTGSSLSGQSGDKTQPSRGERDVWLVKIDASGNKVWDKTYGGSANDGTRAITATPDGGFIVGAETGSGIGYERTAPLIGNYDFWVFKIDASGNKIWDKTYGGLAADYLHSIYTVNNGVILAGFSNSGVNGTKTEPNKGQEDYWIVKIDFDGNQLWDQSYGGNGSDLLLQVAPTVNGGLLILGVSKSPAGIDKTNPAFGDQDWWIIKTDSLGNKLWDQTIGGSGYDYLNLQSIKENSDQSLYICGVSASNRSGTNTKFIGNLANLVSEEY